MYYNALLSWDQRYIFNTLTIFEKITKNTFSDDNTILSKEDSALEATSLQRAVNGISTWMYQWHTKLKWFGFLTQSKYYIKFEV